MLSKIVPKDPLSSTEGKGVVSLSPTFNNFSQHTPITQTQHTSSLNSRDQLFGKQIILNMNPL